MKTSLKGLFLSTLLLAASAFDVQAAPFARVIQKNAQATIVELGDTNGLGAVNWMSADFQLNGGTILQHILAGLGSPAAPWSITGPDTLRIQINYDLTPYAVGVMLCSWDGSCADNSERLARHLNAPSATCGGVAPCTDGLAMIHTVAAERLAGNGQWGVGVFEMTVDRPTLITGLEWLYIPGPLYSGPVYWNTMQAKLNIWSSQAALILDPSHGDVSNWGNFTYTIPSGFFEQVGASTVYKLEMKYTGNNQSAQERIMLYPGNTYFVSPFMFTSLEAAGMPMSVNQIGLGDYYMGSSNQFLTYLPQTWASSTMTVDMFGIKQP